MVPENQKSCEYPKSRIPLQYSHGLKHFYDRKDSKVTLSIERT